MRKRDESPLRRLLFGPDRPDAVDIAYAGSEAGFVAVVNLYVTAVRGWGSESFMLGLLTLCLALKTYRTYRDFATGV